MVSDKIVSNAVGGKTARACDACIVKRARWYCAADDAFLCQTCDSSVHSANPLARRHERVRLKTASSKKPNNVVEVATPPIPSWHRGITKRARSPRQPKTPKSEMDPSKNTFPDDLVPENSFYETSSLGDENEEQLFNYRVPIYDPLSEMDLEEFAADVESLLGKGLENESFGIEELGLVDCTESTSEEFCFGSDQLRVKMENEACHFDHMSMDMTREPFVLNFDYDSLAKEEEGQQRKHRTKKDMLLRLDFEAVAAAWDDSQRCPWTTGVRPDLGECWPDLMGACGTEVHNPHGETSEKTTIMGDGGREARVSRYREKRRTRLFSKKIRYEVRKLNAEKRPRMKGRFVKRVSFASVPPSIPLLGK